MTSPASIPPPALRALPDGSWELAEDWSVSLADGAVTVPRGMRTDGASIPRFLWRVCGHPLEVPRLYAALVHDYMYTVGAPTYTRAYADGEYRALLRRVGVSAFKAWIEWSALRMFGGSHFNDGGNNG